MEAETDIHVGTPKFRLPTSENACPFIFLSLVHRTTSHGGDGVSVSPESGSSWLVREGLRVFGLRKAGEEARGGVRVEDDRRDWKRLSKGRKDGVGLSRPGLEATEGSILLPPGEERKEPCVDCQ
jgi:hypothetical protein